MQKLTGFVSAPTSIGVFEAKGETYKECTKAALFDCIEVYIKCEEPSFFGVPGVYGKVSRTCTSTVRGYETKKLENIKTKQCIDINSVVASISPTAGTEKATSVIDSSREAKPQTAEVKEKAVEPSSSIEK